MSTHALGWPQNGKILNSDLDSEDINRMRLKIIKPWQTLLFSKIYNNSTAKSSTPLQQKNKSCIYTHIPYIGHISQQKIH